ncbi:MAG: hypothetical protein HXS46_15665, partial [Theionarchaea archaeon]|nr:hypothetical protein [Theionarchaea archaeon]
MGNRMYIVDYDIPTEPAKNKVQSYRDLKRLSIYSEDYSTLSVFRTRDEYVAHAVYLLVLAHKGNAHMYRAVEVVP